MSSSKLPVSADIQISIGDHLFFMKANFQASEKIEFDLGNKTLNDNLFELFSREQSQIVTVDEGDKLKKVQGFRERFSYWRKGKHKEVSPIISQVLQQLDQFLQTKTKESTQVKETYRFVIQNFFSKNGKIGRLPQKLFDPNAIEKEGGLKYFLLPQNTVQFKCGPDQFFQFRSEKFKGDDLPFPLSLELENSDASANFWMLLQQKKGGLFAVDSTGKHLYKVSGLRERIRYHWRNRKGEEERKTKEVLKKTFNSLNFKLSRELSEIERKVYRVVISYLFRTNGAIKSLTEEHDLLSEAPFRESALSWFAMPVNTIRLKVGEGKSMLFTSDKLAPHYLNVKGSIDWDLKNDDFNNTFWSFLTREKGMRYSLNQEGELIVIRGLAERIRYRKHKEAIDETINFKFNGLIKSLDDQLSQADRSQDPVFSLLLRHFFDEQGVIGRLSRKIFSRSHFHKCYKIEELLEPVLETKRKAFKETIVQFKKQETAVNWLKLEEACIDYVYAEMSFAHVVGIPLKKISKEGSGGARFAFDRFKKKVLVIKPGDEGPYGINNPNWVKASIKRALGSEKRCLKGNSEPLAEVDSYSIDRSFSLNIVPTTDLRYVASMDFVGPRVKDCSLQMYVQGCKPLEDYLKIPKWVNHMPRTFMRWYFGGLEEHQKKTLSKRVQSLLQWLRVKLGGEAFEKQLNQKLPPDKMRSMFERVGVHNFLSEDTDCHFKNILVREESVIPKNTLVKKLFNSKEKLSDQEIDTFVEDFFKENYFQEFLGHFLLSEKIETDSETTQISLVKHDGGGSNPHHHPNGYFSTRYKHLFEVLPHFREKFSTEIQDKFLNNNGDPSFLTFLESKLYRALNKLFEDVEGCENFDMFWKKNCLLFQEWMLVREAKRKAEIEMTILSQLKAPMGISPNRYKRTVKKELKRIHQNIRTRVDSWEVLQAHLAQNEPMRALFKTMTPKQFKAKLEEIHKNGIDWISTQKISQIPSIIAPSSTKGESKRLTLSIHEGKA